MYIHICLPQTGRSSLSLTSGIASIADGNELKVKSLSPKKPLITAVDTQLLKIEKDFTMELQSKLSELMKLLRIEEEKTLTAQEDSVQNRNELNKLQHILDETLKANYALKENVDTQKLGLTSNMTACKEEIR